ncbi:MAG: hypothetical protein AAF696_01160 [Bacteroidota bacterium]
MILQLFIAAACMLEALRIFILAKDMRTLAYEKGEEPNVWGTYTILLWLGVESLVVYFWCLKFGYNLSLVAGVILGIVVARFCHHFLRRSLESKGTDQLEDKIDEIGSQTEV